MHGLEERKTSHLLVLYSVLMGTPLVGLPNDIQDKLYSLPSQHKDGGLLDTSVTGNPMFGELNCVFGRMEMGIL